MNINVIEEAIANIASASKALEKYCNDPENYNLFASHLLDKITWELRKRADDLREINYLYVS